MRHLFARQPGFEIGVGIAITRDPLLGPGRALLAHPVLIADDWRQGESRGKDGALVVGATIGLPRQERVSRRSGFSGCGGEEYATTAQLTDPGIRRDCRGFRVPRSG